MNVAHQLDSPRRMTRMRAWERSMLATERRMQRERLVKRIGDWLAGVIVLGGAWWLVIVILEVMAR